MVLLMGLWLRSLRYVVTAREYVAFHAASYRWLFPTAYVLRLINTWLTVLLTVDRYVAVCRPLHAHRLCTMKRTCLQIVSVIIFSFAFCLPRYFEYFYNYK